MKEPPRNEEELLNRNLWVLLLIQAGLGGLGIFLSLQLTLGGIIPLNPWNTNPSLSYTVGFDTFALTQMKARTMFITTIYIFEAFFIWTFRRPNKSAYKSITEELHKPLLFICLFALAIHVLLVCFSFSVNTAINDVLGLNLNFLFLSFDDWLFCILLASPGIIGIEIFKYIARMRNIYF